MTVCRSFIVITQKKESSYYNSTVSESLTIIAQVHFGMQHEAWIVELEVKGQSAKLKHQFCQGSFPSEIHR